MNYAIEVLKAKLKERACAQPLTREGMKLQRMQIESIKRAISILEV
ncbi:MAG TPA: hypothetical protein VFD03_12235 [Clostridia bacterium]|nr:hypothetical protein [Clostridia bacterium]